MAKTFSKKNVSVFNFIMFASHAFFLLARITKPYANIQVDSLGNLSMLQLESHTIC